ncbi:MAG: penicillin-binding protein 2 [Chloroflexi bacterium]|nr:penicillin-binding protein 2 [Chloroflexota bacterium]
MRYVLVLVLAFLLAACTSSEPTPTPAAAPVSPTEPPPTATPVPRRPEDAANAFFSQWQQGQYSAMYDLLSTDAQATIARDAFVRRYTNIHDGIGEQKLTAQATGPADSNGQVPFTVTRSLAIFGDVSESNTLQVVQDPSGTWKIAWQPGLIFNQLTSTNQVRVTSDVPKRGRIVDRSGKPLADNGSVLSVGVVPGQIQDEGAMLQALSDALGIPQDTIKQRYQGGQPDWFMPITDRAEDERDDLQSKIGSIPGVALQDKPARVYPLGSVAAHVVGYVSHPTADDLQKMPAAGYDETDWLGRAGIEAWGEQQLAGTRGGVIQIVDSTGKVVREITRKASVPGQDITLTLDSAIQNAAMTGLGDKIGSVVVLDPRDNSVLALASQPSFDPNQFVIGVTDDQWQQMNGPDRPLVLRAAESGYPTGSIFKVITMAAGMEKGVARTSDVYDCGLDWNGLPGVTLHNWQPEGKLMLSEALTESCNPAFYEIGLKLDQLDPTILPNYARTFGLGQSTGIVGVSDSAGTVPDPTWKQQQIGEAWTSGDSVNLAIGQGYLLATPLQMANAYAALARGGSLLPPVLVSGQAQEAKPLDLSPTTQAAILDGMKRVTSTPAGTAYYAFKDEKLPIAAKTGSAENENPDAHAWFVGYLPPDKPTLLVLVMVEGGQHGGTVAAPIARSLVDMAYPLSH